MKSNPLSLHENQNPLVFFFICWTFFTFFRSYSTATISIMFLFLYVPLFCFVIVLLQLSLWEFFLIWNMWEINFQILKWCWFSPHPWLKENYFFLENGMHCSVVFWPSVYRTGSDAVLILINNAFFFFWETLKIFLFLIVVLKFPTVVV